MSPKLVKRKIIKYAAPPPELPIYGKVDPKNCSFFGQTNYEAILEEKKFIFGVLRQDRRRHLYVVGKSGVGKSKLLELLVRQDIIYNQGMCLIDPHGDVFDAILDFIPKNRIEDTILIDPSDREWPVSFNPLVNVAPELKHQVTQGFIEVVKKQFGANWSPRLEHVFRFVTLALLDYPEATMRGMIFMLTDRNYRQNVLNYIEDDMVKHFWAIEFADWSERFDNEAIVPLVNKLSQFLSDPLLRHIFGQVENKIDFEKIMNEQKILLVNLAKGKLGEENSSFFGSMFITKIYQGGIARAKFSEKERKDFYVYVDEFQNLMTNTFENLFAESRKYGICMNVAHQYLGQLLPGVKQTVFGNSGSIVVFRVGGDDAKELEAEMQPIFEANDMLNLGTQEFYIKLSINGQNYDPFSAQTLSVGPPPHISFKKEIIEHCRKNYALPLEEVKKMFGREEKERLEEAQKTQKKEKKDDSEKDDSGGDSSQAPMI